VKQRKNCSLVQFLIGRRPMSFSPGAVATIALWKSAPMITSKLLQHSDPDSYVNRLSGTSFVTPPPCKETKYCDEHVCVSVCVSDGMSASIYPKLHVRFLPNFSGQMWVKVYGWREKRVVPFWHELPTTLKDKIINSVHSLWKLQ